MRTILCLIFGFIDQTVVGGCCHCRPCATPSSFGFKMLATPAIRQNTLADIETVIAVARYFWNFFVPRRSVGYLNLSQIISKWRPMAVELGADLHDLSALSVAFEF